MCTEMVLEKFLVFPRISVGFLFFFVFFLMFCKTCNQLSEIIPQQSVMFLSFKL